MSRDYGLELDDVEHARLQRQAAGVHGLEHAASLLRPGGSVFLLDLDTTMIRVRPPVAPVSEMGERFHAYQRARGNDTSVGLRLPELLGNAGLDLAEYRGFCRVRRRESGQRGPTWAARQAMVEAGVATTADVERWADEFDALDRAPDQPWIIGCGFTAIGRRPAGPDG